MTDWLSHALSDKAINYFVKQLSQKLRSTFLLYITNVYSKDTCRFVLKLQCIGLCKANPPPSPFQPPPTLLIYQNKSYRDFCEYLNCNNVQIGSLQLSIWLESVMGDFSKVSDRQLRWRAFTWQNIESWNRTTFVTMLCHNGQK